MTTYRIVSSAGIDLGTFDAATPEAALDALAVEAGYRSHNDACDVTGDDPAAWKTEPRNGLTLLTLGPTSESLASTALENARRAWGPGWTRLDSSSRQAQAALFVADLMAAGHDADWPRVMKLALLGAVS